MWLCSPNPAAPNPGGPSCWGEISFTDGNYMCSMAFSVPIHRRVGTATLAGEDKSMVMVWEKMEGGVGWTPNGVIQNAIQESEWHRRWELPPKWATHTVSAQFSSRFLKLGCKQWVTQREEGFLWHSGSSEEKHETARNDREVRVLDGGKQHMGSRGEGAFGILAAVLHPSLTHIDLRGPVHFCCKNLAPGTPGTKWKTLNF